ncbi:hypothetical protein R5R35_008899 [Gryllus longicercus]|uniref:Uncharacterized protein n=1 Tax=Gryllus longicercus TaxID=2509291 RepID=A0AAN9VNL1_9ORTH
MVSAIHNRVNYNSPNKRVIININSEPELNLWKERGIDELVSQHTMSFFTRFNINSDFLNTDPSLWESNNYYQEARHCLSFVKVVNDTAERAVALVSQFNSSLTRNEEQKQYLFKVVAEHRRAHPTADKLNL